MGKFKVNSQKGQTPLNSKRVNEPAEFDHYQIFSNFDKLITVCGNITRGSTDHIAWVIILSHILTSWDPDILKLGNCSRSHNVQEHMCVLL